MSLTVVTSCLMDNGTAARLLTLAAAAELIGCSEMHVRRLIALGEIAAVDIAAPGSSKTKTRVRADDLGAYIASRPAPSPKRAAGQ